MDLRYPIGKFQAPESFTQEQLQSYIKTIEEAPALYEAAVKELSEEQLNTPYRPEGWTIRQVIHHVPDSHMNAYIRFHWTLTEDHPTIKAYKEAKWAELPYLQEVPIELSLDLMKSIHARWSILLKSLSIEDFEKTYLHPDYNKVFALKTVVALYAWHCKHHLAHIESLKERMGW
ncbi:MAG: putative metal-dependent hydrolase [Cytophagia bacterium]|nr:putative metal-dependent hydrolase [Cytophagia bacterium]